MSRPAVVEVAAFDTPLGWIAVAGSRSVVGQVVYGHPCEAAALAALDVPIEPGPRHGNWCPDLIRRLEEYAAGVPTSFADVELDLAHLTTFQQRVVKHCRAISYGQSRTYQQLAAAAGAPRAARAVGTTMALNRFAIIVPCHRVVHSGGGHGAKGKSRGLRARRRLLEMELGTLAASGEPIRPSRMRRAVAASR